MPNGPLAHIAWAQALLPSSMSGKVTPITGAEVPTPDCPMGPKRPLPTL